MSNMSYCRFQNTLKDLADCENALQEGVSEDIPTFDRTEEQEAILGLIELCGEIYHNYEKYPTCQDDDEY